MYCSNCGAKIVGKPNFCSSCGHKIDYTSNQQLQAFPVKKSNGFTLASKENVIIGNGHYESVTPLLKVEDKRFFTVTEGYNQGIIDENGKVILPMEFNSVRTILNYSSTDKDHADGLIADKVLVYKERKFGIFDLKTGSLVIPVSYYNISSISYDHNLILINESYDVKFFNLTTLAISDNFYSSRKSGYLYIDLTTWSYESENFIFNTQSYIPLFNTSDQLFYYYNISGQKLSTRGFKEASLFVNGYARVSTGYSMYLLDKNGKLNHECKYIGNLQSDLIAFTEKDGRVNFKRATDFNIALSLPAEVTRAQSFLGAIAIVENSREDINFVNSSGKILLKEWLTSSIYEDTNEFHETHKNYETIGVFKNSTWTFGYAMAGYSGKLFTKFKYEYPEAIAEDIWLLAEKKSEKKALFIRDKIVTKAIYESFEKFDNYVLLEKERGAEVYLTSINNFLSVPDYNNNGHAQEVFGKLKIPVGNDQYRLINTSGEHIFSAEDFIVEENHLSFMTSGKFGLLSLDGKEIIMPHYENISHLFKDIFCLYKNSNTILLFSIREGAIILERNNVSDCFYDADSNIIQFAHNNGEDYLLEYLDENLSTILKPQFSHIERNINHELVIAEETDGIYRILDRSYQPINDLNYDHAEFSDYFGEQMILTVIGEKNMYLDKNGQILYEIG